jgi:hypothetical protein
VSNFDWKGHRYFIISKLFLIISAIPHSYPVAPIKFGLIGGKAAYGSYKSLVSSSLDCCAPGTNLNVTGATVIRVKQNAVQRLVLNEIEIYDENNVNVALDSECYSYSKGWGGDPACLNDGEYAVDCFFHSSSASIENYVYCVLTGPLTISKVKIIPMQGGDRWKNGWITDLQLEVFSGVYGQDSSAEFFGLLDSHQITSFAGYQTDPAEIDSKCSCLLFEGKNINRLH